MLSHAGEHDDENDQIHAIEVALGPTGTPGPLLTALAATSVVGPDAFGAGAVVGTSTQFARQDHDHGLPANPVPSFATPSAVGQSNTTGSAATINHSDHVHQGVTSLAAGTGIAVTGGDGSGHGAVTAAVTTAIALVQENVNTVATSSTAQTIPDVTSDTINYITLTANCTFTFPTAAAGKSFMLGLLQDATGSRTVTWPGTVKWSGGTAPTLTTAAAKLDLFSFACLDGTNWLGVVAGQNF